MARGAITATIPARGARVAMIATGLLAATGLLLAAGCGGRDDGAGLAALAIDAGVEDAAIDAAPVDAGPAPGTVAAPVQVPIAPELQALVTAWLEAQNRRDFAAYQALYHPRFHGVRRAGAVVTRFDRAGWLRDRASGFRTLPRLAIDAIAVYAGAHHRQVLVAVRATSGGRTLARTIDLVVADDGPALRILFEEALDPRGAAPALASLPVAPAGNRDHWFGYDRAWSLATMRVAPIVDGQALVARTTVAGAPIDPVVTAAVLDPVAGGVRAAQVEARLPPGAALAQLEGQAVVVLDRGLAERCRGTLGPVTVRAAGRLADAVSDAQVGPTRDAAIVAATWALGPHVIAAAVRAPCTGAYVRGVAAKPIVRAIDHGELPVPLLRALGRDLSDDGLLQIEIAAELGRERAGFALYARARAASCTEPAQAGRLLYTLVRERRRWQLTRVAELAGASVSMIVADLDDDGGLDAIVAGGAYVGGQLDVWDPDLTIPWPPGPACR